MVRIDMIIKYVLVVMTINIIDGELCPDIIHDVKDMVGKNCSSAYDCHREAESFGLICCNGECLLQDRSEPVSNLQQGESCSWDSSNNRGPWQCPGGCDHSLLCINSTCTSSILPDGCSCVADNDCWLDGSDPSETNRKQFCINGQCITPFYNGEPCTIGEQCISQICNYTCVGLPEGHICNPKDPDVCADSLQCQYNGDTSYVCSGFGMLGDDCADSYQGPNCDYRFECVENTCISKPGYGETCRWECNSKDLYCSYNDPNPVCKRKLPQGRRFRTRNTPSAEGAHKNAPECLDDYAVGSPNMDEDYYYNATCATKCCTFNASCPLGENDFSQTNRCVNDQCLPTTAEELKQQDSSSDNLTANARFQTDNVVRRWPECESEFDPFYGLILKHGGESSDIHTWSTLDQKYYFHMLCCIICATSDHSGMNNMRSLDCATLTRNAQISEPPVCSHTAQLLPPDVRCGNWQRPSSLPPFAMTCAGFNCPSNLRLISYPGQIEGTDADTCCQPISCGYWHEHLGQCAMGYSLDTSKINTVPLDPNGSGDYMTCCTMNCLGWANNCPNGKGINVDTQDKIILNEVTCCLDTCFTWNDCDPVVSVLNHNMSFIVPQIGNEQESCCMDTCAGWNFCEAGTALLNFSQSVVPPPNAEQETCCANSCQRYNCPPGQGLIQQNRNYVPANRVNCCTATCLNIHLLVPFCLLNGQIFDPYSSSLIPTIPEESVNTCCIPERSTCETYSCPSDTCLNWDNRLSTILNASVCCINGEVKTARIFPDPHIISWDFNEYYDVQYVGDFILTKSPKRGRDQNYIQINAKFFRSENAQPDGTGWTGIEQVGVLFANNRGEQTALNFQFTNGVISRNDNDGTGWHILGMDTLSNGDIFAMNLAAFPQATGIVTQPHFSYSIVIPDTTCEQQTTIEITKSWSGNTHYGWSVSVSSRAHSGIFWGAIEGIFQKFDGQRDDVQHCVPITNPWCEQPGMRPTFQNQAMTLLSIPGNPLRARRELNDNDCIGDARIEAEAACDHMKDFPPGFEGCIFDVCVGGCTDCIESYNLPCPDNCNNVGECVNETCYCYEGFAGPNCSNAALFKMKIENEVPVCPPLAGYKVKANMIFEDYQIKVTPILYLVPYSMDGWDLCIRSMPPTNSIKGLIYQNSTGQCGYVPDWWDLEMLLPTTMSDVMHMNCLYIPDSHCNLNFYTEINGVTGNANSLLTRKVSDTYTCAKLCTDMAQCMVYQWDHIDLWCDLYPLGQTLPDINGVVCQKPTMSPTISPTISPTMYPTISPTISPTMYPTMPPTMPTTMPTTMPPTNNNTAPSMSPTTRKVINGNTTTTSAPTFMYISSFNRVGIFQSYHIFCLFFIIL